MVLCWFTVGISVLVENEFAVLAKVEVAVFAAASTPTCTFTVLIQEIIQSIYYVCIIHCARTRAAAAGRMN
jgi:hypothetical protein